MKKSNILLIAFLFISLSAMMTSCNKENIDNENIDPDEVEVVTEIINPAECDNSIFVDCIDFQFNATGQANLFRLTDNCAAGGGTNFPLNYQILDANWDLIEEWEPRIYGPGDWIRGFQFGTELDMEVGDKITMWRSHFGPIFFQSDTSDDLYMLADDYEVTLTAVGDELGEYIGGEFSGAFVSRETGQAYEFGAQFCVPITFVCE